MFKKKFFLPLIVLILCVIAPPLVIAANKPDIKETIIISDMSRCLPAVALSKVRKKNHWQLIPYEGEGLNGVILGAASLIQAPDVTLPLEVNGWYAIYIGFFNPHYAYDGGLTIKLKLTDDPCFRNISDPAPPWTNKIELKEAFFKYADLTGQNLIIGQQSKGTPKKAYMAYVKLVPLSQKQVEAVKKDRARKDTRILYALNDGNGLFYRNPSTREDVLEEIEQYRYSDVGTLMFAAASGDIVNYPSKIGTPWLAEAGDSVATAGHKILRESLQTLLKNGIVPMQVFLEHSHDMGIDFHAMFRLGIIGDIPPSDLWENSKGIVRQRPELRMVDMDGTPIEKASYAYPQVREYMLSIIREVAEGYDIDGVNLCFIRGPHFVGYEDIVIKDFKAKHGIDPRDLDENDIRAQRHRAGYLTEFVRSARTLVNQVSNNKCKKIQLSAMVYSAEADQAENLFFGFDVKTWLQEELLDGIVMSSPYDKEIIEMVHSHKCKVITNLMPSGPEATGKPAETVRMALMGLNAGVDGFRAWDLNSRQEKPEFWEVFKRVGHKEDMEKFSRALPKMKTIKLKTVGGFDVSHLTNRGAKQRGYWPQEMLNIYSGG